MKSRAGVRKHFSCLFLPTLSVSDPEVSFGTSKTSWGNRGSHLVGVILLRDMGEPPWKGFQEGISDVLKNLGLYYRITK